MCVIDTHHLSPKQSHQHCICLYLVCSVPWRSKHQAHVAWLQGHLELFWGHLEAILGPCCGHICSRDMIICCGHVYLSLFGDFLRSIHLVILSIIIITSMIHDAPCYHANDHFCNVSSLRTLHVFECWLVSCVYIWIRGCVHRHCAGAQDTYVYSSAAHKQLHSNSSVVQEHVSLHIRASHLFGRRPTITLGCSDMITSAILVNCIIFFWIRSIELCGAETGCVREKMLIWHSFDGYAGSWLDLSSWVWWPTL